MSKAQRGKEHTNTERYLDEEIHGKEKIKQIHLPQKAGRETQADIRPLLRCHTLPRRGGLLDPCTGCLVRALDRWEASLQVQGDHIVTITELKAGPVNH